MTCPDCERPMATDANLRADDTPRPDDDLLCWRVFHNDRCQQPIDWRARCQALDAENTALVDELFFQATGRDIDTRFAASAQAGAEWQARRTEEAERQLAEARENTACERELWEIFADSRWEEVWSRDAALDACQERIAGLLAERARFVAAFDEANANAPRALTDALAAITRIAVERDQARRQVATLQATVLRLLALASWPSWPGTLAANLVTAGALHVARRGGAHFADSCTRWRPGCGTPYADTFAESGEHWLDCGSCGLAFNATHLCDGAEVECTGCGASNTVAIDEDGRVYVCVWACAHGIGHEDKCERCAAAESTVRESAEVITEKR